MGWLAMTRQEQASGDAFTQVTLSNNETDRLKMGDYHTLARRTMEIILPEGHIIPPEGCIIPPEGRRRPQVEAARRRDNAARRRNTVA